LSRRRSARRGYILIYVLVLSLVMGALVLAYQESFRQRNVQVRLNSDRVSARFLARAAIDAMRWGFRESPDPARLAGNPDLESGPILPFVLADQAGMQRRIARKVSGAADHRALLEQLLGAEALAGLDRLTAEVPGAQVQVFAELAPGAGPVGPVKDPAQKTVALTLKAVARVRRAVESYAFAETMTVYSLLPVAAKFTLAGVDVGSVNTGRITTDGQAGEGPPPLVLFHAPGDCDVLSASPFEGTPGSEKPLVEKAVPARDIPRVEGDRGFVFLDSTETDRSVRLNVGSGGTPFGEMHGIYRPDAGKQHVPAPAPIPDAPPKIATFRPASPTNPGVQQAVELEGAALGFHKETNAQGALRAPPVTAFAELGLPAPEENPEADPNATPEPAPSPSAPPAEVIGASRIKLYGTGTFPSPTAVLGNVQRVLAWITDLGVDRDATADDENAQATAVGRKLPVADAHEPVLVSCDEATYRSDVGGEGSAVVTYRRLRPFGEQGQVTNANAVVDVDGVETPVAGEDPVFALDLTLWKYSALFDDYKQYSAFMSHELAIPANLSLHLPALAPAQAGELLRNLALGRPAPLPVDDFYLKEAHVDHRDRLHPLFGSGTDGLTWLDLKGAAPDALRNALTEGLAKRHPSDDPVIVHGQGELEREFFTGNALDLRGLRVKVVSDRDRTPAVLRFSTPLNVRPGSGGVLEVEQFEAPGILNPGQGEAFAPFVLRAHELTLAGKGPYEALIATSQVKQEDTRAFSVIRGALFVEDPAFDLKYPLVVSYDPRLDPTADTAPLYYRVAYQPGARGYELLERP